MTYLYKMSIIRVNSIKPISGQIVSLSGSLIVTGDVTAEQFITEKVQTSIIYRSGSTLLEILQMIYITSQVQYLLVED